MTRRAAEIALTLLVVLASLASLAHDTMTGAPVPSDGIAAMLMQYQRVADRLPPRGQIGLVRAAGDPVMLDAAQYVAQYGLAPRILVTDLGDVDVVITTPYAAAGTDADPRLAGFSLQSIRDGGIRVYRRRR